MVKLTYVDNLEYLIGVESNERYAFEQVDICKAKYLERSLLLINLMLLCTRVPNLMLSVPSMEQARLLN
ncbi:hypothetical protein [Vibrio algarum]|uniref:Uncharacterized protein n=1 Tax=Vibrio algarum TaxID=3020714 RepID=A0ABT4YMI4_9VIBR|nr:hypothetical protein [Vibrio sp. KJ40-1]MDB1122436.1 hypothetical protein [Vibrio sp. KJ40-1]